MDYGIAKEKLEAHATWCKKYNQGNPDKKKLQHQTYLTWSEKDEAGIDEWTDEVGDAYVVSLFQNPILHFRKSFFTITDSGWFSKTTHQRLNDYMPRGFSVYAGVPTTLRATGFIKGIDRATMGFIKTPKGVFPYNMPTSFLYDGSYYPPEAPTNSAQEDANGISQYITRFLEVALNGTAFWQVDLDRRRNYISGPLEELVTGTWADQSSAMARFMQEGRFCIPMLALCIPQNAMGMDGVSLHDMAKLIEEEGFDVFKRVKTDADLAKRLEITLAYKIPVPAVTRNWFKSEMRPYLAKWIVGRLGFDQVTWNRR